MTRSSPQDELDIVSQRLSQMMDKLWQWHAGEFCPTDAWAPSVNLYHLERRLEVCVDLAGVNRQKIDVRIEPGRLVIRGVRQAPEPLRQADESMRIVSMEINHGPFCRIVNLPERVELTRVDSEYVDGLLWIHLPLRGPG